MTLDFLTIEDLLAALATLADAIGEGFVALSLGFASAPTGIGFLVGAGALLVFRSVVPVSFEVESLTVVSRLCERDWKRMAQSVLVAGVVGAALGFLGVFGMIVDFIDGPILSGMMTGVGLILSFVAYETFKENRIIGGVSIVVALGTFFLLINDPNNLIYALFASVAAAIVVSRFVEFKPIVDPNAPREKIGLIPLDRFAFLKDIRVIRAALALLAPANRHAASPIQGSTGSCPGPSRTWTTRTSSPDSPAPHPPRSAVLPWSPSSRARPLRPTP